jgi:hypothetical protein
MRTVELTPTEKALARSVNARCDAIVKHARQHARALSRAIMAAAIEQARALSEIEVIDLVELVRARGVEIGADEVVLAQVDPKTRAAIALQIRPRTSPPPAMVSPEEVPHARRADSAGDAEVR